jgi:hypothetical protein
MPIRAKAAPGLRIAHVLACVALIAGLAPAAGSRAADQGSQPKHEWHWHLTGIILGPDLREALFATDGETRVVLQGARIDGWTVAEVYPGGATLRVNGEEKRLHTDEWLPDDQRAADSLRRERMAEAAMTVAAASDSQKHDQAVAEQVLRQATANMVRLKTR